MSKHKQIDQCADIIVYTMEEFPHSIKIEATLQIMLTTMSIFLSDKDMIDMIKNKVIPKLSDTVHTDYFGFISDQLNNLEDENNSAGL
jgi:hypothetical protein